MNFAENPQLLREWYQQNPQQLALKEAETAQDGKRRLDPELLQVGGGYKQGLLFMEKEE